MALAAALRILPSFSSFLQCRSQDTTQEGKRNQRCCQYRRSYCCSRSQDEEGSAGQTRKDSRLRERLARMPKYLECRRRRRCRQRVGALRSCPDLNSIRARATATLAYSLRERLGGSGTASEVASKQASRRKRGVEAMEEVQGIIEHATLELPSHSIVHH